MGFYVRYLVVAVLGALAVWHGTPEIQACWDVRLEADPPAAPSTHAFPEPDSARSGPLRIDSPSPSGTPRPIDEPASPSPATAPSAAQVPPPSPETELRPERATPAARSPYDWGILPEATRAYGADGQPRDRIPGGTVVEIQSEHDSSNGRLLRCRVLLQERWRVGFFFPESAVIRFQGGFEEAPRAERDQLIEFFGLKDRITSRRAELQERAVRANPHFQEYQAAARALLEHQEQARALVAERETATGLRRDQLGRELRRMKAQEGPLLHRFETIDKPYRRWRSDNDDGSLAIASDRQIQEWEQRLETLEPVVRRMVRGL